jgi:excisionase family DNA binding protein
MDTVSETPTQTAALLAAEIGPFITVAEAAGILRVTKTTIYTLVDDGVFGDVVRVGRVIRIPVAAFRAYVSAPAAA